MNTALDPNAHFQFYNAVYAVRMNWNILFLSMLIWEKYFILHVFLIWNFSFKQYNLLIFGKIWTTVSWFGEYDWEWSACLVVNLHAYWHGFPYANPWKKFSKRIVTFDYKNQNQKNNCWLKYYPIYTRKWNK